MLAEGSSYIHFHRDLSAAPITTDMSQVGEESYLFSIPTAVLILQLDLPAGR